jgi:organic hydroperoxide reductase OsmC/OhrA
MTRRADLSPFSTETVWNAGLSGTGSCGEGQSLTIGHDAEWSPEHLLLFAAEACVMSTLLTLALDAGIDVLGYVSTGRLHVPAEPLSLPTLSLVPCIVVATDDEAGRVRRLVRQAVEESIVARLLGDRLTVAADVRAVPGAPAS